MSNNSYTSLPKEYFDRYAMKDMERFVTAWNEHQDSPRKIEHPRDLVCSGHALRLRIHINQYTSLSLRTYLREYLISTGVYPDTKTGWEKGTLALLLTQKTPPKLVYSKQFFLQNMVQDMQKYIEAYEWLTSGAIRYDPDKAWDQLHTIVVDIRGKQMSFQSYLAYYHRAFIGDEFRMAWSRDTLTVFMNQYERLCEALSSK